MHFALIQIPIIAHPEIALKSAYFTLYYPNQVVILNIQSNFIRSGLEKQFHASGQVGDQFTQPGPFRAGRWPRPMLEVMKHI